MVKDVYSEKEVAFSPVFNVKASNTVYISGMYSEWMQRILWTIFMSLIKTEALIYVSKKKVEQLF